jgi:hypothetical protein
MSRPRGIPSAGRSVKSSLAEFSFTACCAAAVRIVFHTYILVHMRITVLIDESLLERAREVTGIQDKTALLRAGLEALIAREAGKRLAALGGTQPALSNIPRRRPRDC